MTCPSCGGRLAPDSFGNRPRICPYCGNAVPEDGRASQAPVTVSMHYGIGWEYKSKLTVFGLPLIHIASGVDPKTRRPRVARGIFAAGNIAVGVVAVGGVALGGLTLGGASLGLVCFGGLAIGGAAFGGLALGGYLALGGLAISLGYAAGGLALAPCALSGAGGDPACFEPLLERVREFGVWMG